MPDVTRSQEKTDFLISAWDHGTLWTDFGVRADILVRFVRSALIYKIEIIFIAIHSWFSPGRHPRAFIPWSTSSSHQGNIQGPSRNVGEWVSYRRAWRGSSTWNYCGHWPSASYTHLFYVLTNPIYIVSLLYLHFLDCAASQMAEIFNSGRAMIQRRSWRWNDYSILHFMFIKTLGVGLPCSDCRTCAIWDG